MDDFKLVLKWSICCMYYLLRTYFLRSFICWPYFISEFQRTEGVAISLFTMAGTQGGGAARRMLKVQGNDSISFGDEGFCRGW